MALFDDGAGGNIWLGLIFLALQLGASIHILRTKIDAPSAMSWLGVVWLVPILGLVLYLLFGINRIERRARAARQRSGLPARRGLVDAPPSPPLDRLWPDAPDRWRAHDRLAGRVTHLPPTAGNRICPVGDGRAAYDEMLAAIDTAEHSVLLTSYIFQADSIGRRFIASLKRAAARGVDVRVLVDAVGNFYGFRPVAGLLRRGGVPVASFNPARLSWRLAFFNLRTHRKMLILDGRHAFIGGMNIRKNHIVQDSPDGKAVRDLQFHVEGSVIHQMIDTFADDWVFATGKPWDPPEVIQDDIHDVSETVSDLSVARAIPDGPDEPLDRTSMLMASALGAARRQVRIISPYFLPLEPLRHALRQAALRGVQVDILIPAHSNLPLFSAIVRVGLPSLLDAGCRIFLSPPPFDHAKVMVVDDDWALIGSSNWDARSLKLNFEFNVEAYGRTLANSLSDIMKERFAASQKVSLDDLRAHPRLTRFAGRLAWLLSPYL
ncbi:phospholipase D-like domain-containing protein [Eilatimonas milleporae]|uniref:Phospholipase D n=1 Tax=Eilatimonas milleporae TaxID=911205 RepID=A0A3M0C0A8_9PROT|nr:phospholipase D-like domain-containing protein [Eilatimonas milleporae]RMB02047.1 cardiolipin synthase [Eilatimonas milleporae]